MPITEQSDSELARKAAAGDQAAFIVLVERHQGMVSGVALSLMKNVAASEDIAQETFLSAWKKIGGLHDSSKVRPWLATIARNTALSHLRMKKNKVKSQELAETMGDSALGPDQVSAHKDDLSLVLNTLEGLPEKYRTPLVLFYREDQSVAAVAEALGLSTDAVKQRLKRGRDELRDQVESTLAKTLRRTAPAAVFTASVVTALSALTPATATAAAGLSLTSVTTSGSATSTTVAAGAIMNSTKFSLSIAALIGIAAIPAGYGVGALFSKQKTAPNGSKLTHVEVKSQPLIPRDSIQIPPSQIAAEWKHLQETHGDSASSFSAIAQEIKERKDGFLKSGLVATLAAEWARVDGQGGFEYSQQRGTIWKFARLFNDEWMKLDPNAAIDAHLGTEYKTQSLSRSLPILAMHSPQIFRERLNDFRFDDGVNVEAKERALRILAKADPIELRDASQKLEGRSQEIVLGAALSEWALQDGRGALAWTLENLTEGSKAQMEGVYSTLKGWAEVNPQEALDQLQKVMAEVSFENDSGDLLSYLSSGLLAEMAKKDFATAMAWWGSNRGVIKESRTNNDFNQFVLNRLAQNPTEVLSELSKNGLMDAMQLSFTQNQLNQDYLPKWREIGKVLAAQPNSRGKSALLSTLTTRLMRSQPENLMEFVQMVEDSENPQGYYGKTLRARAIENALKTGGLAETEKLVQQYPEWAQEIRVEGLRKFARAGGSDQAVPKRDFQQWLEVSQTMEAEDYQKVFTPLAATYLSRDPTEAFRWMEGLPEERFASTSRELSMADAFGEWASQDPRASLRWMESNDLSGYPDDVRITMGDVLAHHAADLKLFWNLFRSMPDTSQRDRMMFALGLNESRTLEETVAELRAQSLPVEELARYEQTLRSSDQISF